MNAPQIQEQFAHNIETEKKIDVARNEYRPAAKRAAILYFVLNDLSSVDPMYQVSSSCCLPISASTVPDESLPLLHPPLRH